MVLVPLGADHEVNAHAVERAGAGIKVDSDASEQTFREVIAAVFEGGTFRAAAQTLRDEIACMPDPGAVAHILGQLAAR